MKEKTPKWQFEILLSPGFVLGLLLLLANDFVFKSAFHNSITGKLSDFAGLFVFPLFLTVFARRTKWVIFLLTALGFGYWKSIYSQPLINAWNDLQLFHIGRTVDISDLAALAVLPASYIYGLRHEKSFQNSITTKSGFAKHRFATGCIILISVFAFTAAQRKGDHMVSEGKEYEFQTSTTRLLDRLNNIGLGRVTHHRISDEAAEQHRKIKGTPLTEEERNAYTFSTSTKYCNDTVSANITLHDRKGKSILKVEHLIYNCDMGGPQQDQEATRIFEQDVTDKLSADFQVRPD